jgi:hypothetical protein
MASFRIPISPTKWRACRRKMGTGQHHPCGGVSFGMCSFSTCGPSNQAPWLVTYDDEVLDAFPDTAIHPSEFLSMHGD